MAKQNMPEVKLSFLLSNVSVDLKSHSTNRLCLWGQLSYSMCLVKYLGVS